MSALKEEERQAKKSKTPSELRSNLSGNKMCTQAGAPIRRFHQLERGATGGENEAWCPPVPSVLASLGLISSPSLCLPEQVTPSQTPLPPWGADGPNLSPESLLEGITSTETLRSLPPTLGVCMVLGQVRPVQVCPLWPHLSPQLTVSCKSQC